MRAILMALAFVGVLSAPAFAQGMAEPSVAGDIAQPKAAGRSASGQIDYQGFQSIAAEVETYRQARLIDHAAFERMAHDANTLVLDARSADAYAAGHIAGAINLPFTDFTDQSLAATIGDTNRPILIYCNNNFENNQNPVLLKRIELALNIQTFINLYGYGYRNVYELADRVNFNDPDVRWVRA